MLTNLFNKRRVLIEKLSIYAEVRENVDLKDYNTFKVSSICEIFIVPNDKDSLLKIIKLLKENKEEYFILGNGSNVIFKNKVTKKVIISLLKFNKISIENNTVYAECGAMLPILVSKTIEEELVGLEAFFGIPGTVGGSLYGNAGCYGEELGSKVLSVEVLMDDEYKTLNNNELYFSYRDSIFKKEKNIIILGAYFFLEYGDKEKTLELIKERTNKRKETQPLEYPSAGCTFRNPLGSYAGALIESCELKGYHINDAYVSEKHANFIVNKGNASGEDIVKLLEIIKKKVKDKYNTDLINEYIIID